MPKNPPKLWLHRPSGRARVRVNGDDVYLGMHGTPEADKAYRKFIAEWAAAGTVPKPKSTLTLNELIDAYLDHVDTYYVKDGKPTSETWCVRSAIRFALDIYNGIAAPEFGPLALQAVRQRMIEWKLARSTINGNIHRLRKMFKWAASVELLPVGVYQALLTVRGLEEGRGHGAREPEPIEPVANDVVKVTFEKLPQIERDMIELQRLSGMRPGEVVILRPCDIHQGKPCWLCVPLTHKTKHKKKQRVIVFGPKAQKILRRYLPGCVADDFLFCPPGARKHDRYTVDRYRQNIQRACLKAKVKKWHPHQLRHTAATTIDAAFDLDAVKSVLSHGSLKMSDHYVLRDVKKAIEVMRKIG